MDEHMNIEIAELRSQLRSQRRLSLVAGFVALLALLFGVLRGSVDAEEKPQQPIPRYPVLQAERFELVNEKGELLGALKRHSKTGAPILALYDTDGQPRAALCLNEKRHPILDFSDTEGEQRLRLYVDYDQVGRLEMFDDKLNANVDIYGGKLPKLWMRAGSPYTRFQLDVGAKGSTVLLRGDDTDTEVNIGVNEEGKPKLEMWDERRNKVFEDPK